MTFFSGFLQRLNATLSSGDIAILKTDERYICGFVVAAVLGFAVWYGDDRFAKRGETGET